MNNQSINEFELKELENLDKKYHFNVEKELETIKSFLKQKEGKDWLQEFGKEHEDINELMN